MDTHSVHGHFQTNFAGNELGHSGFEVNPLSGGFFCRGVVYQGTCTLNFGSQVCQFELECLGVCNGFSKRFPLLLVLDGSFERGLGHAYCPCSYVYSTRF